MESRRKVSGDLHERVSGIYPVQAALAMCRVKGDAHMERLAEEIRRRAGEAGPRLTALRRHLHRHPEPAWGEYLTASLVARALQDAGFRLTLGANALRPSARPRQPEAAFCTAQSGRALNEGADPTLVACMAGGLTGLWGDLDLDSPGTPEDERGPLVAFRFDMDANAGITEATDKDHFPAAQGFASCHAGCMHACGHDGHVALGVELARLLGGLRDELSRHLSGRIRLIFQPAEEEGEGAPGMVAAGAVDGVRALFGLHLSMQASRSGDLVCGTDKFLATTNFEVFFTGQSAHAGLAPHEGRNALLAACTAVTNLLAIARAGGSGGTHGQGHGQLPRSAPQGRLLGIGGLWLVHEQGAGRRRSGGLSAAGCRQARRASHQPFHL